MDKIMLKYILTERPGKLSQYLKLQDYFDMVSLFIDISNFVGYLRPKPSL